MSRLKVALLFSSLAQQSSLIISLVSMILIARFLTPAEIGVYAVASSITIIATELRAFGVNQYLVREAELGKDKLSTALGVMMLISWTLGFAIIYFAPSISDFYNYPDLKYLIWITSITFFIAPFATIPFSMFIRNMEFKTIFKIRIISTFLGSSSAVVLVIYGYSYYGLAASVVIGSTSELILIHYYDESKTKTVPKLTLWREILAFGLSTSGSAVLQKLSQNASDIVLGKTNTMTDVGIFSKGTGLIMFIERFLSTAISRIMLPHLSEIKRANGNVGIEYLRCITSYSAVAIPALAVASIISEPLIVLFFGDQWTDAAPISSILAAWAVFKSVHMFLPSALVATGNEKMLFTKELVVTISKFILIIGITTQTNNLTTIAIAVCASGLIELIVCSYICKSKLGINYVSQISSVLFSALIATGCWFIAKGTTVLLAGKTEHILEIASVGLLSSVSWLILLATMNHELWYKIKALISRKTLQDDMHN